MDYISSIKDYVRQHEDPERFAHSLQTSELCRSLAVRFGLDEELLSAAGIWHDIARGWSDERLASYVDTYDLPALRYERDEPKLLHGITAAHLFQRSQFFDRYAPEQQESFLMAVRWHTIGHREMGAAGYVLFIADFVEPGRVHLTAAEKEAILSCSTLEQMMRRILKLQFAYFLKKGISYENGPTEDLYEFLS